MGSGGGGGVGTSVHCVKRIVYFRFFLNIAKVVYLLACVCIILFCSLTLWCPCGTIMLNACAEDKSTLFAVTLTNIARFFLRQNSCRLHDATLKPQID